MACHPGCLCHRNFYSAISIDGGASPCATELFSLPPPSLRVPRGFERWVVTKWRAQPRGSIESFRTGYNRHRSRVLPSRFDRERCKCKLSRIAGRHAAPAKGLFHPRRLTQSFEGHTRGTWPLACILPRDFTNYLLNVTPIYRWNRKTGNRRKR